LSFRKQGKGDTVRIGRCCAEWYLEIKAGWHSMKIKILEKKSNILSSLRRLQSGIFKWNNLI
jgi:hypothetical protein